MAKYYNIALIPINDRDQFIRYAHALSSTVSADTYHIGVDASIAHISLCHFTAEPEQIDAIWQQVQDLDWPTLHMTFDHHRSKSYPDNTIMVDICWVSLMPDHLEQLKERHLQVAKIIQHPLNASFEQYDPHMTLFNSLASTACADFNRHSDVTPSLKDDFKVALGFIDAVGQITELIYTQV